MPDNPPDPAEFPNPADLLAHRPPFLLVDRITALEPGVSCTAIWHLTGEEDFFAGHFPGRPTLPGVLMVEALAQTAGLAALSGDAFAGRLPLFGGIDKARFRRQVVPGDTLTLEATLGRMSARAGRATGTASVDGALACGAEMFFVIADQPTLFTT
ncbi:MAG TPA: 3-hydroxyacyl-[acyl-carrier-protein] dehydratase FabZ [Acidimicrobiaceae bacterium]|nr:3-hydroxyacyl-[acyl-carrier-protein] dehydratase FabZ [Acidimicrobiaceae bacterium]HCB37843.1 3-hydroxyacyl-[acyl-carrier-protein] dehydratase FabZ [Acidimicrobiaceae bacterium]